jgi:predicted AlkP superfamily pyrophosphatase or phosphodiesterase
MSPVILFMLDGLRPDALAAADCPNLNALRRRGAWTLHAASVMPSVTLPCHMTIFHSVPPTRHGITSNDWTPMARPLPGLVDVAKGDGLRCAFYHNWEPLRNLNRPGSLYYSYFRDTVYSPDGDDHIAAEAARAIPADRPDFAFVYLGTIDTLGHQHGWMSSEYLRQVSRVDRGVGQVLDALPADYTVLVNSDHGGHDRSHGTDLPEDLRVPWIVAGPGVRQGLEIAGPVSLMDTAPTAAHFLGLKPHPEWEGRLPIDILE